MQSRFGIFLRAARLVAVIGVPLGGMIAASPRAAASIISSSTPDSVYVANGAALTGELVSVTVSVQGFVFTASGALVAPNLVLLAGHEVSGNGLTADSISVSTGPNFNTNPGTTVAGVKQIVYPTFNSTFDFPDLALVVLASPLPYSGLSITSTGAVIGSNEIFGGFGRSAVAGGTPVQDGNARGWSMEIVNFNPSNLSPTYYTSGATFGEAGTANAYDLDSGGVVINPVTGQLDGIIVAQAGGTGFPGETSFDNLAQPEIHDWVTQSIATYAAPEPSSLMLLTTGAGLLAFRRRRTMRSCVGSGFTRLQLQLALSRKG